MATIVEHGLEHAPHHHLMHAVRGHDQIVAAIAEHAQEQHQALEAIREERGSVVLDGSPASPGTM